MKRIIAFLFVLILVFTIAVPAFAYTPKFEYRPVTLPEIKVSVKIPDKVFTDWFKEHPLDIKINYTSPVLG